MGDRYVVLYNNFHDYSDLCILTMHLKLLVCFDDILYSIKTRIYSIEVLGMLQEKCNNTVVACVFHYKSTVWVCESRLGAPRFKELRSGGVGRHQVSLWIVCLLSGPVGIIGYTVANHNHKGTRQGYCTVWDTHLLND